MVVDFHSFDSKEANVFPSFFYRIDSNKAMTEICETGKCHQVAASESVLRANEMFDTLRKNDICEETEATQKK